MPNSGITLPPVKSSVTVSAPPPASMVMLVTSAKRKRLTQAGAGRVDRLAEVGAAQRSRPSVIAGHQVGDARAVEDEKPADAAPLSVVGDAGVDNPAAVVRGLQARRGREQRHDVGQFLDHNR